MSDLIERQAAIDALEALSANYTGDGEREWHPHVRECQYEIEHLPPAQPQSTMGQANEAAQSANGCISRRAAIDAMCKACSDWCDEGVCRKVSAIQKLPPAQQWISCDERLPEVETYVLISKKPFNFRSNLPSVCMAHRSCDPRSGKEKWYDMLFGELDDDDVLAWMPLPEPVKVEN